MSLIFKQMTSIEGKVDSWVALICIVLCLALFLVCLYFNF